jgi:membrane protease YdiL (CAAX protease family)
MWIPGLGAILVTRQQGKSIIKTLGINKFGKRRIYFWAWSIPILTSLASGLIAWGLGWAEYDSTFPTMRAALEAMPEDVNISVNLIMLLQIGASITIAPLINTIFALGEELGWRGFLLPKLLPLGQTPAIILSGVIWGIWHTPAILQGHNYPGFPFLGVGMMVIFTVLLGIFFSWLYLRTKSPWAPAFSHGTVNAVAGLPLALFTNVKFPLLAGALTTLSGWIPLAAVVVTLYFLGEFPLKTLDIVSRETLDPEPISNPSLVSEMDLPPREITPEQVEESRYDE